MTAGLGVACCATCNVRFFLNDSPGAECDHHGECRDAVERAERDGSGPGRECDGGDRERARERGRLDRLYVATDPDSTFVDWRYLSGSKTRPASGLTSASVLFTPTVPGTYNVRFFQNDSATKLATSASITVQ